MVADRHDDLVRAFDERGRRADKAHADMHAAFRAGLRDADPAAYGSLVDEFRSATRAALHGVGPDIYARIDAGDRTALDIAVAFLAADPWFFSSGYVKANLIRRLKRAQLDEARCERLRRAVLHAVTTRDRREFRDYCRLARAVTRPNLIVTLRVRSLDPDPGVRRRAGWMLKYVAP